MCDPVTGHTAAKSKDCEIYVTTRGEKYHHLFVWKAPIKYSSRNSFSTVISIAFAHRALARTRARSLQITRSDA